jgi:hypothetical protein
MKHRINVFGILLLAILFMGCPNPVTTKSNSDTNTTDLIASTIMFSDGIKVIRILDSSRYTNTVRGVGDGSIIYTSENPYVATVDAKTGEVTPIAAGTSIITATKASTATYATVTAHYTVVIIKPVLPLLEITTDSNHPVEDKENWIKGTLVITDNGIKTDLCNLEIKGRGNSTWEMPKKPYTLKLDKKESLLGMETNKRWVLLANYSDKTLLRTTFAFDLGLSVYNNLKWTPNGRLVEVVMNNEYIGVYQLVEQIRIDKKRVDIDLNKGDFLMEVNARLDEKSNFRTTRGVCFSFNEPEEPDTTQLDEIKEKLQRIEDVIYSDNFSDATAGYAKYIDVNSFIDWYLINEFTKNNDACFFSSVYMYSKDSKIFMGPIWDFDISSGNIDYNGCDNPENYWIRNSMWISRLFEDASFVEKVKARWNEKKLILQDHIDEIPEKAFDLNSAANSNFQRWDILNTYVWPNRVVTGSYNGEVLALVAWLNTRYAWIDSDINK